jgi:hypothetical protein
MSRSRNSPFEAICLLGLLVIAEPVGAAEELELLHTIGTDDRDVQIHRPGQIAFANDGSTYVCNEGSCRILHFDTEWRLVNGFSRCGGGPGEFEQSTGMLIHGERLWIVEPARVTIFGLDGQYQETRRSRAQLAEPVHVGGEILCRASTGGEAIASIDEQLEIVSRFGPTCPRDDPRARARACAHLQILAHPDHRCVLVNPMDGTLYTIGGDGSVLDTYRLHGERGDASFEEGEGLLVARFRPVLGRGFIDPNANLWCLIERKDDEAQQKIEVWNRRFERVADYVLPESVTGFLLARSPRDQLVLLDYAGSQIHVLAVPERFRQEEPAL